MRERKRRKDTVPWTYVSGWALQGARRRRKKEKEDVKKVWNPHTETKSFFSTAGRCRNFSVWFQSASFSIVRHSKRAHWFLLCHSNMYIKTILFQSFYFEISHLIQCDTCQIFVAGNCFKLNQTKCFSVYCTNPLQKLTHTGLNKAKNTSTEQSWTSVVLKAQRYPAQSSATPFMEQMKNNTCRKWLTLSVQYSTSVPINRFLNEWHYHSKCIK